MGRVNCSPYRREWIKQERKVARSFDWHFHNRAFNAVETRQLRGKQLSKNTNEEAVRQLGPRFYWVGAFKNETLAETKASACDPHFGQHRSAGDDVAFKAEATSSGSCA